MRATAKALVAPHQRQPATETARWSVLPDMGSMNHSRGLHGLRPAQVKHLAIILCGLATLYILAAIVGGSLGAMLRDNPQPIIIDKGKNSA